MHSLLRTLGAAVAVLTVSACAGVGELPDRITTQETFAQVSAIRQPWIDVQAHAYRATQQQGLKLRNCTSESDAANCLDLPDHWRKLVMDLRKLPLSARLKKVTNAVNRQDGVDDLDLHGEPEHWETGAEFLRRAMGDSEEFALGKMLLLHASGVPADDMRLMIAKNIRYNAYEALLLVRTTDGMRVLNFRTDRPIAVDDMLFYKPYYTLATDGYRAHVEPSA
jgi:predicted transglutaminase-like cysteine proteinase